MNTDDPRHGTNAGYVAGCRCDPCTKATWRYHKRLMLDHASGKRRLVASTGTRRRLEALMALGWTGQMLAEALGGGIDWDEVRQYRTRTQVKRSTYERVKALYDDLSMRLPAAETRYERQVISRTRNYARRMGWPPPLFWDDIDTDPEPTRTPTRKPGHPETATATLEDFDWLTSAGESPERAANRLGVTLATIDQYRRRVAAREVAC